LRTVQELINDYDLPIVQIDGKRNYWLVRTQSGEYHEEFYFDDFIAIGWDDFNNKEEFENPSNEGYLKKQIASKYPESKQPGLIYNQIRRFFTEMKLGDLVMIPSKNSTHISFGKVVSEPYIADIPSTDIEEGICPFQKRLDVDWIKTAKRAELDPYLYKMMNSHHTINNANEYASFIDRTLHSFYMKNGNAHLVMRIKKQGVLNGLDFFEFGQMIIDLLPEVKNLGFTKEEINKRKDIKVKSNVQSPGIVEFISSTPAIILGVGVLLTFLVGGKAEFKYTKKEKNASVQSKGLVELFIKYKKQKSEDELEKMREKHRQTMDRVKAEIPKELNKLPDRKNQEE